MGCDIHMIREIKHNGRWIAVDLFQGHHARWQEGHPYTAPVATERHYKRFAHIAGVRAYDENVDYPEPKGLPDDISQTADYIINTHWGEDGHSHTWLDLDEACRIWLLTDDEVDPNSWKAKYPASHYFHHDDHEQYEDVRLLIWFDN